MTLTRQDLEREAAATGFAAETLEKAIRLLSLLNDRGEIAPDLLTSDETMGATIREHPALRWKALNATRRGRGADQDEG